MICAPHLSGIGTNCIVNGTNLLTVSSAQRFTQQPAQLTQIPYELSSAIERIQCGVSYDELINPEMDEYEKHTFAFLGSMIEVGIINKMKARSVSGCKDCLNIFGEDIKIRDSFMSKKIRSSSSHTVQPCVSTVNIIVASSTFMKILKSQIDFNDLIAAILPCLDIDQLYDSSSFQNHQSHNIMSNTAIQLTHKEEFVRSIVNEFMHIKSRKICDRITTQEHKGVNIRKRNTKNTIFAGQ